MINANCIDFVLINTRRSIYKVGYGIVTNTWKININIIIVKHGKSNLNQFTWWERSSCFLWESVLECHAMESSFFYFRCIYYHSFCYIMGLDNCHLLIGVSSSRPFFFQIFFKFSYLYMHFYVEDVQIKHLCIKVLQITLRVLLDVCTVL